MALKTKKTPPRTFNDVLTLLGGQRFDVAPAQDGAKRGPNAVQVRKYGCAAEIAPAPDGTVEIVTRSGWMLNGVISRLVDRGYQKFLKTNKLEYSVTADHLRALHAVTDDV